MADSRPNFVIVLADDLGCGDLACYGHPHLHTPHLDRLAEQGLRLTDCHSPAANCSPARTGLLTGRTPNRAGIYSWIPMFSPMHLRESEITVTPQGRSSPGIWIDPFAIHVDGVDHCCRFFGVECAGKVEQYFSWRSMRH